MTHGCPNRKFMNLHVEEITSWYLLCEWVKASWKEDSTEMVKASFMSCAIIAAANSSNDSEIHCFKEGQPCEGGLSMLKDETQQLLQKLATSSDDDNEDPFADDSDADEMESNELCIDNDMDEDDAEEIGSDG